MAKNQWKPAVLSSNKLPGILKKIRIVLLLGDSSSAISSHSRHQVILIKSQNVASL